MRLSCMYASKIAPEGQLRFQVAPFFQFAYKQNCYELPNRVNSRGASISYLNARQREELTAPQNMPLMYS
jgi:hypothetical protein